MATRETKLIASLVDKVTAPARAMSAALDNINKAARRNDLAIAAVQQKLIGAAATAYAFGKSFAAPIKAASEFQTLMLDIGQKADMDDSALAVLGRQIRELAPTLNKSATEVAKGVDYLLGVGLDRDRAMTIISPLTKAATAYRADIEDLAKAGYAALDNLKVPADQLGRALDAMAQSGKEGAFELRDMAQYLPSLGAAFQGLGQTGVKSVADLGAALQIVRKGAGDSAEAANNLANLLQKVVAPDSVKNFKKFGINIRDELKKSQKAGESPIEMVARLTDKALKGDLAKLGDLFQDAQVQKALRPLIQNMKLYQEIRQKALKAQGVVEEDFARRSKTAAAMMAAFRARVENLSITVGNALLPGLVAVMDTLAPIVERFNRFTEANPALIRNLSLAAAALVSFRVAALAAQFMALQFKGALLQVATVAMAASLACGRLVKAMLIAPVVGAVSAAFRGLRTAVVGYAAAAAVAGHGAALRMMLLGLLNPAKLAAGAIYLVTGALRVMKLALISTGIGAILVAIGAAAAFIVQNWRGIVVAAEAFGAAFQKAVAPVEPLLRPVISAVSTVWGWFSKLTGEVDASGKKWDAWGTAAGTAVGEAVLAMTQFIQRAATWVSETAAAIANSATQMYQAGQAMVQSLWDGAVAKFNAFIEWVKGIPGRIRAAIGSIDLSNIIRLPSFGSTPATTAPAGTRANGGPVSAGSPYLVGERGPELFVPRQSGRVESSGITRALRAATVAGAVAGPMASPAMAQQAAPVTQTFNVTVNAPNVSDPQQVAQIVMRELGSQMRRTRDRTFADVV